MNADTDSQLSIGQCATLACLLEVNAPKPGNVHRSADFDDATLNDFTASAVAIGPILEDAVNLGVGMTALKCVQATRLVTRTNTNLGTILLLAPLACASQDERRTGTTARPSRTGKSARPTSSVSEVLDALSSADAEAVYEAIRLAQPGGLGNADEMDVQSAPPNSLLDAMQVAAERDSVAAEYVNNFSLTLKTIAPAIVAGVEDKLPLPLAIVQTQLQLLAAQGDSLIARKCGDDVNAQCQTRAARVLAAGSPREENFQAALADFDFWLRSDGRRRNPGTTADLIAAGLFVCLRDGLIRQPYG